MDDPLRSRRPGVGGVHPEHHSRERHGRGLLDLVLLLGIGIGTLAAISRRARTSRRDPHPDAVLTDGQTLQLYRLEYAGYANMWGFAIYRASHDDYQNSYPPTGHSAGTAEDALDTACGLCLADPTAWT
ncbi:hypothetical protein GCM10023094_33920 [Rhodococcus olei]|uniref:Uncharacterized protein n=1 Tax=Rhodococcus olei TaxID=2161675 RepID=A0ABP8P9N4_9NOCA